MSTHFFNDKLTCEVQVQFGYDVSAGRFVLEIIHYGIDTDCGFARVLYSSRTDQNFPGNDLNYCRDLLADIGISIPGTAYRELLADADGARTISKRIVHHYHDGRRFEKVPD